MEPECGLWGHLERELRAVVGTEDLVVVCLGDISQGTWFVGRNWNGRSGLCGASRVAFEGLGHWEWRGLSAIQDEPGLGRGRLGGELSDPKGR